MVAGGMNVTGVGIAEAEVFHSLPSAGFALEFDGTNDFVHVPHDPSLSLGSFTIEAWVRVDVPPGGRHQPLMSKGNDYGNYSGEVDVSEYPGPAYAFYIHAIASGNFSCCIHPSSQVNLDEWVHLAWTWAGSSQTFKLFINGVDIYPPGLVGVSPPQQNIENLYFGRSPFPAPTPDRFLNGQLDEIRIWNVVRTPAEILARYNRTIDPNTAGLVGYWNFDEIQTDQRVLDSSSLGNDGMLGADSGVAADDPSRVRSGAPIR